MTVEDFTTWTESDPSNRLSQTAARSTFTNLYRTDDNTYLWKNKAGELQNFILYFSFKISSIDNDTSTIRLMALTVTNNRDDYTDNRLAGETQFGLQIRSASSTTKYWFVAYETWTGSLYTTAGAVDSKDVGTTYYVKITKSGTSLNIRTYSDPEYTTQIESLNLTLHANHNLTYLLVPQSAKLATAIKASGYVEDLRDALDGSKDLFAKFSIQGLLDSSQDLKATFELAQDISELYSRFYLKQGVNIVGPSLVADSDLAEAIRYSVQSESVFAANRHWVFYIDRGPGPVFEPRAGYKSSPDGINWTARTLIGEHDGSGTVSVHYDGTYLHYARIRSQILYYRRGIPNTDGTITWSAAEQTVIDNAGSYIYCPSIAVLAGGYPAIAYHREEPSQYYPRVIISDNNDGTWSGLETDTILNNYVDVWAVSLHTFGSGLYALYNRDGANILGKEYSGGWQSEEDTGYKNATRVNFSAVIKNGEVHVAYVDDDDDDIYHGYRTVGGVWQSETKIQAGSYTDAALKLLPTSTFYVFWLDTDKEEILYRKSTDNGSTWKDEAGNDTPQKFFDSPAIISAGYDIQAHEGARGGHISVIWNTGASYNIYFGEYGPLDGIAKELFGEFKVQLGGSTALFADFWIPYDGTKDLPAEVIVRHTESADLHCFFHVGQDSRDLSSEVTIRHTATPIEINAEFITRHTTYSDLHNFFHVGQDSEPLKTLTLVSGIGYIVKGEYVF